jgi:hypothetical protein
LSEQVASTLVAVAGVYVAIGLLFAIAFALVGAGRVDPAAREGSWGFRLLIVPGATALWPLLAWRWLRGTTPPPCERNAHRDAAREGES